MKIRQYEITIGMPVFNGQKSIRQAIESILNQKFRNFRILISDNASTDETESICKEYELLDERVSYIRQNKNIGMIENFKYVLTNSKTEYFMWVAADDTYDNRFLELALEVMKKTPDIGLVFSEFNIKNILNGRIIPIEVGYSASKKKKYRYLYRLQQGAPNLIYGLHRTELLKKFDLKSYDYFDLHMTHWYELKSKIKVLPIDLYISVIE
jgi:glycosyltransferase involved in cell wall biosynthesis